MHVAMLNIDMDEQNTIGIQWESKNRCVTHGIRGGTLKWKGDAYLVILVSWILDVHIGYSLSVINVQWVAKIPLDSIQTLFMNFIFLSYIFVDKAQAQNRYNEMSPTQPPAPGYDPTHTPTTGYDPEYIKSIGGIMKIAQLVSG